MANQYSVLGIRPEFDWQPDETHTYDDNGNRDDYYYNVGTNNRMTQDGTYTYTYDDEGNRTSRYIIGSPNTDVTDYTWDHRNRLVKVTHYATAGESSDEEIVYEYDYADRLIRRQRDPDGAGGSNPLEQTVYVYDGQHILLQFDDTGPADLSHRYLHGPAIDQVLADEQVHYDSGQTNYVTDKLYWTLTDNLGSVRDLAEYNAGTDTTTIANHRVFDAFGNITSETASSVDHLFAYTGRVWDEDAGLYNYRTRSYDPETGKFLSEDWIGFATGDPNLARYVGNNAPNYIDPSGQWPYWFTAADYAAVRAAADLAAARRNAQTGWFSTFTAVASGFFEGANAGLSSLVYAYSRPVETVTGSDFGASDYYDEAWENSGLDGTLTQDLTNAASVVSAGAAYSAAALKAVELLGGQGGGDTPDPPGGPNAPNQIPEFDPRLPRFTPPDIPGGGAPAVEPPPGWWPPPGGVG